MKRICILIFAAILVVFNIMARDMSNGHEYVDLGLPSGTLWATCNVGATSPEEYGGYYTWPNSAQAASTWGGPWEMMTKNDKDELTTYCTYSEEILNDVKGVRYTGPNGNSIFLPFTGYKQGSSYLKQGEEGQYWTSTPYEEGKSYWVLAIDKPIQENNHAHYWPMYYFYQSLRLVIHNYIASGTTGTVDWTIDGNGNLLVFPTNGVEGTMSDARPWKDYVEKIKTAKFTGIVHAPTSCYMMFDGCTNLTSIDFGIFDTSNVTDMRRMFNKCSSLISLNVSNFKTHNVTTMYAMFNGCYELASLDVSGFDTSNVTDMYAMFKNCSNLKALNISNFTNTKAESTVLFEGCQNLNAIYSNVATPSALLVGTFENSLPTIGTCKLYIPKGSIDAYRNADGWNELMSEYFVEIGGSITLVDAEPYINSLSAEYEEISYVRNFKNTNWQALYIPFSMSYDDWKDNFEVARINAFFYHNGDVNDQYLNVIKVTSGTIKPNTPYLIKALEEGEKTITVENAMLYAAKENSIDCSSVDYKYTFTGTYDGVSGDEMYDNQYFAMSGGNLKRASSSSATLSPYRWYVKEESRDGETPASSKASVIYIEIDGEVVDALDTITLKPETGNSDTIYNLQGQCVDEGQLAPGVYIKNGKKILVK